MNLDYNASERNQFIIGGINGKVLIKNQMLSIKFVIRMKKTSKYYL